MCTLYCFVALSLVAYAAFGSSICFLDTCYVNLPGYPIETKKEIICGDSNDNNLLYNKCIVSCNKPNVCSKTIKCPYNGMECVINCKSDESCNNAIIIVQNTKYTQLNLQFELQNNSLIIEPNNNNGTLTINNKIINTENKCANLLIDTRNNNVNIECAAYNKANNDNNRQLLMYNNTNVTEYPDIIELNEAKINKTSQEKESVLVIVTSLLLAVLLCCSFYLLLVCVCSHFKQNAERHTSVQQEDEDELEEEAEDTLPFYGNGGIELQMAETDAYLNMMNEMLSVKSISVIST